jgi:Tfp pilus assembly protein PilN
VASASAVASELSRALAARGIAIESVPPEWADRASAADALAARFAADSVGPLLATEVDLAAVTARRNRATAIVAAVAALVIIAIPLVRLWGVHRELAAVEAQRAALHAEVSATLIGRTTVEDAYRRLAVIAASQRGAAHWAVVFGELADRMPDDAWLTTARVRGDSLVLDGMAASAARVFDAIDGTPGLMHVTAAAPVRREAPKGSDALERFTLAALRHDSSAASSSPARSGRAAP